MNAAANPGSAVSMTHSVSRHAPRLLCARAQMALPTDEDLKETGTADAGEYILAMQETSPRAYLRFLESHRPKHKDPDGSDFEECQLQVSIHPLFAHSSLLPLVPPTLVSHNQRSATIQPAGRMDRHRWNH